MKIKQIVLAIGAMVTSFAPYAEVGLNFGKELSPIIVQGEEMGFFSSTDDFILENGENQIVFRMEKLIQNNGGERAKFNSHAFVMSFTANNTELLLEPDMRVLRESESIEFNRNPKIKLMDSNGARVDFKIDVLPAGDTLTRDYSKELANYNRAHGLQFAALTESVATETTTQVPRLAVETKNLSNSGVNASAMIDYWMKKATAQESETFTDWAFDHRSDEKVKPLDGSQALNMLSYWYGEASMTERKQILAWLVSQ